MDDTVGCVEVLAGVSDVVNMLARNLKRFSAGGNSNEAAVASLDSTLEFACGVMLVLADERISKVLTFFVLKVILVFIFISFHSSYFSFYLVFVLQIISVLVSVSVN
jgi:hypothetical protein